MATQDNDGVITFGSTTAVINTPAKWGLYSTVTGGTLKKTIENITTIIDGDGNAITGNTIANGTTVSVPVGDSDFSLTGGDLAESGRVDVLEAALAEGWYIALIDTNDVELTGSNGLTRQQITVANFS